MNKAMLLKIVNPLLALVFIVQCASGFLMEYGGAWIYGIHKKCSLVLLVLVAAHLILNWSWIKSTFFKK